MKEQLNNAIAKYVTPMAEKFAFKQVNEEAYGMGALVDYVADNLFIRIVNDKGIISFEIAPKHQKDQLRDLALYKEFLIPPKQGVWNMSLAEQTEFLTDNWNWLNQHLAQSTAPETLKKIDECATKRRKTIFG